MSQVVRLVDRRRIGAQDGRACFRLFPEPRFGDRKWYWLYAMGYADGTTKIGLTKNPSQRILGHWINNEGGIAWAHLFQRVPNRGPVIERRACALAAEVGQRIRRTERYRNLSREQALACVRQAIREMT